ncbi:MAG: hypothetical protein JSR34_11080 [Proteobacteria bacterium]|nr:hypothetical protein [Pseudomonadota bacterium]
MDAIAIEQAQRMRRLSLAAGLPAEPAMPLDSGDYAELTACTDIEVVAYAHSLRVRAERWLGHVPVGWTLPSLCRGCGPVWLWLGAPSIVLACPWCWNRKDGRPIPRPP